MVEKPFIKWLLICELQLNCTGGFREKLGEVMVIVVIYRQSAKNPRTAS